MTTDRHQSLDVLRGFAVMGILLMNIVVFAMPFQAYFSPRVFGGTSTADLIAWGVNFVLVDGKMRGLFSLLFGASMLLVIDRARAAGQSGARVHLARMAWLLVFGLIHLVLIWFGDILTLYAICGAIALAFVDKPIASLVRWGIGVLMLHMIVVTAIMGSLFFVESSALAPGASTEAVDGLRSIEAAFGAPGSVDVANELAAYRGGYADALSHRTQGGVFEMAGELATNVADTLGLMLLGMALYKSGFLTGQWDRARYRRTAVWCYAIAVPGSIALAAYLFAVDFATLPSAFVSIAASTPFRLLMTIGHAALLMLIVLRATPSAWIDRVAAVGQTAFTNYLGTSVLMTTLFYGYGFGWFGTLSRWQVYLIPPIVWAIMLFWSQPWLTRFRYGPLEWLWRSLARGSVQPLLR